MNQLFIPLHLSAFKLLLEEVFYSLYVMVCRCFDLLDPFSVLKREVLVDLVQEWLILNHSLDVFWVRSSNLFVKDAFEPFQFHENSVTNQGVFTEVCS